MKPKGGEANSENNICFFDFGLRQPAAGRFLLAPFIGIRYMCREKGFSGKADELRVSIKSLNPYKDTVAGSSMLQNMDRTCLKKLRGVILA